MIRNAIQADPVPIIAALIALRRGWSGDANTLMVVVELLVDTNDEDSRSRTGGGFPHWCMTHHSRRCAPS